MAFIPVSPGYYISGFSLGYSRGFETESPKAIDGSPQEICASRLLGGIYVSGCYCMYYFIYSVAFVFVKEIIDSLEDLCYLRKPLHLPIAFVSARAGQHPLGFEAVRNACIVTHTERFISLILCGLICVGISLGQILSRRK